MIFLSVFFEPNDDQISFVDNSTLTDLMSIEKIILLADDDADDAEMFASVFSEVDPTIGVTTFTSGLGILEYLTQAAGPRPLIIFLDINMPEMTGWQCLTALKSNASLKDIPVIMYSTSSHHRDKQLATELGAAAFITKPSDLKTLRNILTTVSENLRNDGYRSIHKLR
ncbi:response regulator [Pseudochryseolinea flava]|uniref:Response regulator n=1 Tax=Pseudochryseolinea flava TaxID=2059302 RepID=A0A364Y746_9BACT|nr:response regulator [Pseudochryseolinea flava]RAW02934.1 response regulator [Pseudochryseolinea flava]